jgi:formate dehydrogenase iron-sulfur subunit
MSRGKGSEVWGWGTAYGKPAAGGTAPAKKEGGKS